ncbi:MAG: hypothetical protein ACREP9_15520 [Candidatus Dormibacteraceae bacterium]
MITLGADHFPVELLRLLDTARAELDRHVNDHGRCHACQASFPCERACLAELNPRGLLGESQ